MGLPLQPFYSLFLGPVLAVFGGSNIGSFKIFFGGIRRKISFESASAFPASPEYSGASAHLS